MPARDAIYCGIAKLSNLEAERIVRRLNELCVVFELRIGARPLGLRALRITYEIRSRRTARAVL